MKSKRLEIRIREKDIDKIAKAMKICDMNISEIVRLALRFGIPALLKFETGSKWLWDDESKAWAKAKDKIKRLQRPIDQERATTTKSNNTKSVPEDEEEENLEDMFAKIWWMEQDKGEWTGTQEELTQEFRNSPEYNKWKDHNK